MPEERARSLIQHPSCPFCRDAVQPSDEKIACHGCMAWHHADCWGSHGACSACGAKRGDGAQQAEPRPLQAQAVPAGQGGCAWQACTADACPAEGAREGETVYARGRHIPLDDLCVYHTRYCLSLRVLTAGTSAGLLLALTLALGVVFVVVSTKGDLRQPGGTLFFGAMLLASGGGAVVALLSRSRHQGLLEAQPLPDSDNGKG